MEEEQTDNITAMDKKFIIGITAGRNFKQISKYVRREKQFIKKPNSICIKMSTQTCFVGFPERVCWCWMASA